MYSLLHFFLAILPPFLKVTPVFPPQLTTRLAVLALLLVLLYNAVENRQDVVGEVQHLVGGLLSGG
jgi:hypothetical protein